MYIPYELAQLKEIDWSSPNVDVWLCDFAGSQIDVLKQIKKKINQHPNTKVNLISKEGPYWLKVFEDCPNVTFEYTWKRSAIYNLYQGCQNKELLKDIISPNKNYDYTISSFNGGFHWSRLFLTLSLYNAGLWNDKYCTKSRNLTCTLESLKPWQNKGLMKIINNLTVKQIKNFLPYKNEFQYTRYNHFHNIKTLSPIMSRTLINIVTESYGEGSEPYMAEKVFYGVINKTITITVAQPKWYALFNQCLGFKNFTCFDYGFDNEENLLDRIVQIVEQIIKIDKLTIEEKQEIYNQNKDILEYNFEHFISGAWMKVFDKQIHKLDKIVPRLYI